MAKRQRKIEVYCLTISGLPKGTGYVPFLNTLRGHPRPVSDMVMKFGGKSHALNDAMMRENRLNLRFLSFKRGHRPDVLDTEAFSVLPNPLTPTQTNVEWTHALLGEVNGRHVMLVERNTSGIWPSTIEVYLQNMIDRFFDPSAYALDDEEPGPITVNLQIEPGEAFMERIAALERVTEATVRIVRPNPGWADLESSLGSQAGDSDARRVDLSMAARRGSSLNKQTGIVGWIKNAFAQKRLGFAAIRGKRAGLSDAFNTRKLGKHTFVELDVDERGQIESAEAWHKLSKMFNDLD